MLFALGAAASVLDGLQSLAFTPSSSSSPAGQSGTSFDPIAGMADAASSTTPITGGGAQISPQTMSALIAAQSQSGATSTASLDPSQALQDLYSQIDANGDGKITRSEFENALGAGGTNTAMADDVFNKLDTNGDGSISLGELKSALQGAGGHHGGHHHHIAASSDAGGSDGTDATSSTDGSSSDPLMQALDGSSSSSVTNSDGSTTTTITYADGSKVTMSSAAASTGTSSNSASKSAASSYNLIEQMIQQQAQAIAAQAGSSLSLAA